MPHGRGRFQTGLRHEDGNSFRTHLSFLLCLQASAQVAQLEQRVAVKERQLQESTSQLQRERAEHTEKAMGLHRRIEGWTRAPRASLSAQPVTALIWHVCGPANGVSTTPRPAHRAQLPQWCLCLARAASAPTAPSSCVADMERQRREAAAEAERRMEQAVEGARGELLRRVKELEVDREELSSRVESVSRRADEGAAQHRERESEMAKQVGAGGWAPPRCLSGRSEMSRW